MKAPDKIGFWPTTSLVVGNMIGSGVFLLPVALAYYGLNSVFGWLFSAFGAILLSIIFGYLSKHLKNSEGGPYAFHRIWTREVSRVFSCLGILDFNLVYKRCYCSSFGKLPECNISNCWC